MFIYLICLKYIATIVQWYILSDFRLLYVEAM